MTSEVKAGSVATQIVPLGNPSFSGGAQIISLLCLNSSHCESLMTLGNGQQGIWVIINATQTYARLKTHTHTHFVLFFFVCFMKYKLRGSLALILCFVCLILLIVANHTWFPLVMHEFPERLNPFNLLKSDYFKFTYSLCNTPTFTPHLNPNTAGATACCKYSGNCALQHL